MNMLTTEVNMYGPGYFKGCLYPKMSKIADSLAIIGLLSDDTQFLENSPLGVEPQLSFSPVFECFNLLTSKTGRKSLCKENRKMFSECKECQHQDGGSSSKTCVPVRICV